MGTSKSLRMAGTIGGVDSLVKGRSSVASISDFTPEPGTSPEQKTGACIACKQPIPILQQYPSFHRKNLLCLECHRDYSGHSSSPTEINTQLRTAYGITLAEYNHILASQGGGCAICGTKPKRYRRLDVDHDHETGAVRGILCSECNRGIGFLRDSPANLRAAADYLEKHGK